MTNLHLPSRLRSAFLDLAQAVAHVFPEGVVAMGGGSILETRWQHRVSTDVDLFVATDNLAAAYDAAGGMFYARLRGALNRRGLAIDDDTRTLRRERMFLGGTHADGVPWSLAQAAYMDPRHPAVPTIERTGIRAANLTETFMGKIAGRAHNADTSPAAPGKQPIPIRDCFDICVCATLEPGILQRIFDKLPERARRRIAVNYRSAPDDLHKRDPKPLVEPAWAVQLDGVAARIGDAVDARDVGLIPQAESRDQRGAPPGPAEGSRPPQP